MMATYGDSCCQFLGLLSARRGLLPDAISLNAAAGALEHQGCWACGRVEAYNQASSCSYHVACFCCSAALDVATGTEVSASALLAEAQDQADRLLGPEAWA